MDAETEPPWMGSRRVSTQDIQAGLGANVCILEISMVNGTNRELLSDTRREPILGAHTRIHAGDGI